jgi:A/G-specific adenine glycosylase
VWLSEIMLQQTRVEAVVPYYLAFLKRFPTVEALAAAPEQDVLTAWSGLGYYSRARNLHKAAKTIAAAGLPSGYDEIRALPGVGPYTAAAVASIVLNEPRAAIDGNVRRVIGRLANGGADIAAIAEQVLDRKRPGDFNQAMMELGATVCVPREPRCGMCPVERFCEGRAAGRERILPLKAKKPAVTEIELALAVIASRGKVLLLQRAAGEARLAGFHEIPPRELLPALRYRLAGTFTHRIVNDRFRVEVWFANPARRPECKGEWRSSAEIARIPLTTMSRKALHLIHNFGGSGELKY